MQIIQMLLLMTQKISWYPILFSHLNKYNNGSCNTFALNDLRFFIQFSTVINTLHHCQCGYPEMRRWSYDSKWEQCFNLFYFFLFLNSTEWLLYKTLNKEFYRRTGAKETKFLGFFEDQAHFYFLLCKCSIYNTHSYMIYRWWVMAIQVLATWKWWNS